MVLKIRLFLPVITTSYPIPISKVAPTLFPPISDQRQDPTGAGAGTSATT
jgi:hypothetical protein